MGNRGMRRSVEGRVMGWGTQGKQEGTTGTFRKESREFEGGGFGVDYRGSKRSRFWMEEDKRWW